MKVMFATDGSEYAANAASLLAKLPALHPMDLTVVTVTYNPSDPIYDSMQPWNRDYRKQVNDSVQKHYKSIQELIGNCTKSVRMLHLHGHPAHEILEAAQQEKPDLLVLGARGHSMLASLLLGSVSENVAFHANCSVLVLRPETGEDTVGPKAFKRITLAFDGLSRSQAATTEIAELPWQENSKFDLISIAKPVNVYSEYGGVLTTDMTDFRDEIEFKANAARDKLSQQLPKVASKILCVHHVGDAIVQHAKENGSDLIVLGDSGQSSLERFLLGSTSKYVLRHADCSVWISRFPSKEIEPETTLSNQAQLDRLDKQQAESNADPMERAQMQSS